MKSINNEQDMEDDRTKKSEDQNDGGVYGKRIFTAPENPPKPGSPSSDDNVAEEKKPTRQMTGGPDKPTA